MSCHVMLCDEIGLGTEGNDESVGGREGGLTTRLSHTPVAIFASVFAEQGAMRTISAQRRSSMCNIGSPMR
jgi:hypothetical protein